MFPEPSLEGKSFDDKVAIVYLKDVKTIILMYNKTLERFEKLNLVDAVDTLLALCTLTTQIYCVYKSSPQFEIFQYLLAGVFTGGLDFLANFLR